MPEKKTDEIPTYPEFCATYEKENGNDGWKGRIVFAIPNLILSLTIKPAYHLASALSTLAHSVYKTVMESEEVKKAFNTVDQDLYEGWGYLAMMVSDRYGQYWTESSQHQKAMNQGKSIPKPVPPSPPPPPAPDFNVVVNKPFKRLRRTNSVPDMSPNSKAKKEWKPVPLNMSDILAMREKIKKDKKSEEERKPEVSTPPGVQGEKMLKSFLGNLRAQVAHSPSFRSPSSWDDEVPVPSSPYVPPDNTVSGSSSGIGSSSLGTGFLQPKNLFNDE